MIRIIQNNHRDGFEVLQNRLDDLGLGAVILPEYEDALIGVIVNEGLSKARAIYSTDSITQIDAHIIQQEHGVDDQNAVDDALENLHFNILNLFKSNDDLFNQTDPIFISMEVKRHLNFEEYQMNASRTAQKSEDSSMLANWALGLSGETGEVVELVKKGLFHGKELDLEKISKELGDVLWYVSALASQCGLSLSEIAEANLSKLESRYPKGFVKGGGNRD